MSQYTTGEMARLCGVTVRTVQYYDTREILVPSALTEGGRRLYSEDDLRKMKIICFLREIGLSIDVIGQILKEENPGGVIDLLLAQQEAALREELTRQQEKLRKVDELRRSVRQTENFSIDSIADIAHTVENNKKLKKMRWTMLLAGIPVTLLQWGAILLWALKGLWWPMLLWAAAAIPYGIWASRYYYRNTAYICPQCHEIFKPSFREMFWASHTPKTRKLTCVKCGHKGFCVETWGGDAK